MRKNADILKDLKYKEGKYNATILNVEKETAENRITLNETHNKLSIRNMKIEAAKTAHLAKDDEILNLEAELRESQNSLQRHKDD